MNKTILLFTILSRQCRKRRKIKKLKQNNRKVKKNNNTKKNNKPVCCGNGCIHCHSFVIS